MLGDATYASWEITALRSTGDALTEVEAKRAAENWRNLERTAIVEIGDAMNRGSGMIFNEVRDGRYLY